MKLYCLLVFLIFCHCTLAENDAVRLHINGRNIVDGNGNIMKLRGIYTRSEWLSNEKEVENFKSWGVNFIRILLTFDPNYWDAVNNGKKDLNKRCILHEENLRYMDERVAWLEKNKIYYMMEIHWRALGADDNLEKPELLCEQFSKMYELLAKRYSSLNYLMGFSTLSEIHIKPDKYKEYNKIRIAIVDAVHRVDPRFIVSLTGTWWGNVHSLSDKIYIDRPNTMYDFHFYSPRKLTHYRPEYGVIKYPGSTYLKKELKPALKLS
ncbi:MAG: cellulase family glycosylhydrolase, partial [Phycisphaerales bacterium]